MNAFRENASVDIGFDGTDLRLTLPNFDAWLWRRSANSDRIWHEASGSQGYRYDSLLRVKLTATFEGLGRPRNFRCLDGQLRRGDIEIKIEGGRLSLVVHDYEGEFVPRRSRLGVEFRREGISLRFGDAELIIDLVCKTELRPRMEVSDQFQWGGLASAGLVSLGKRS